MRRERHNYDKGSRFDHEVRLDRSLGLLFEQGGQWDRLLATAKANTVFLTSGWLRAWAETYGRHANLLIPQIWRNGDLIAAVALQESDGIIRFAGTGPSDYLDLVIASSLDEQTAGNAAAVMLSSAKDNCARFRCFLLDRVPLENGSFSRLTESASPYYSTRLGTVLAPSMDMETAEEKLQKKSLRRHERALQKQGNLVTETLTRARDILPRLDEFFDQHVRRWEGTPYPSLFQNEIARAFYRTLTAHLDQTGILRFTQIRLNGHLAAAHFGFFHGGRFTWYKPSFEPALARYSPGEVLIKRLIERALAEGAAELDFTIGEEAFKYRFATKTREIATLHITDSRLRARGRRMRLAATRRLRSVLGPEAWNHLKRWIRPS
jgi:CelD/BcsL family acetyltransferase involved in cellulose biosynthesis